MIKTARLKSKAREVLREHSWARPLRLLNVARQAERTGHTDWNKLVEGSAGKWQAAVEAARGPRVLLATNTGINFAAARMDGLLAVALTLRGARVEQLLCDEALPACMVADRSWYPNFARFETTGPGGDICHHCFKPAERQLSALRLPIRRLGDYVTEDERKEISNWADAVDLDNPRSIIIDDYPIGDIALSGALRFFASGTLPVGGLPVLRAYLRAARISITATSRLAAEEKYDAVVLHHGIYVPQGAAAEAFRHNDTRVVTWFPAYRKSCFIFSHDDTYHHTMMSEPVGVWENLQLSERQLDDLRSYLKSRRNGENDWISFNRTPELNAKVFIEAHGIDPAKPLISLLTNVSWDAQLHYPTNVFSSMREWLVKTVRYFAARPDLQLVIRAHPAEVTGLMPAKETAESILREDIGDLPPNVFFVKSTDTTSTYMIAALCKACIIYATKAGIELSTMGIPVIAAGEAWVRGKSLSADASDEAGYYKLLDALPVVDLDMESVVPRAELYAFHFFFRRMIPVRSAKPSKGWPPFSTELESLDAAMPGADLGLDLICRGILEGTPFIHRHEELN